MNWRSRNSLREKVAKFDFLTPEFLKNHQKTLGVKVDLSIFPWKYLGVTDEEFMAEEIKFAHGGVVPKDHQKKLLGVVRAQEQQLLERHEYTVSRDAALRPVHKKSSPQGEQLELF